MRGFFTTFRFKVLLALVISPIVTAGLFVGFVFSNLNKEMDLVRLKSQIELAQVGADKFMTNIKKSEWLNDAIYREVLEANFTNGSALFNTQSDLIYFTVLVPVLLVDYRHLTFL